MPGYPWDTWPVEPPMPPPEWLAKFSASSKGSGGYGWQAGWVAGYTAAKAEGHARPHHEEPVCPFCAIVDDNAPAVFVRRWPDAVAIVPLNPVTAGHTLVIPLRHVEDYLEAPEVTGLVMARAAELGVAPSNLITSAGDAATQTVRHLHVHVVPRRTGDGLPLPWTPTGRPAGGQLPEPAPAPAAGP